MRVGHSALVILGMFAWTSAPCGAQPARELEVLRNGWLSSLEEGRAQAKETGKPLIVVFRCVP